MDRGGGSGGITPVAHLNVSSGFALVPSLDGISRNSFNGACTTGLLTVTAPGTYDALDPVQLDNLKNHDVDVRLLSVTPVVAYARFHVAATTTAALYELSRVFIPLHYQNLRDRIQRQYGLRIESDRALMNLLNQMPGIRQQSDGVFAAEFRSRDDTPRNVILRWSELLKRGFLDSAFDATGLLEALHLWYQPFFQGSRAVSADGASSYGLLECSERADETTLWDIGKGGLARRIRRIGPQDVFRFVGLSQLIESLTVPIDESVIRQIQRTKRASLAVATATSTASIANALFEQSKLWMEYIGAQHTHGQQQKWRGWYLLPEHGPITAPKLLELKRILGALDKRCDGKAVTIDTTHAGIQNAVYLLEAGKVHYQSRYTAVQKRNLFIRQQKNYLLRLGLIEEPAANDIAVSDMGKLWVKAGRDDLPGLFYDVLTTLRWSWCSMPFAGFIERLVASVDGFIGYRELYNWVIHAYDDAQLTHMQRVVEKYRSLSDARKTQLNQRIDVTLRRELETHLSDHALGHYRAKVKDLMIAFAATNHFRLDDSGPLESWVLHRRTTLPS